MNLDDLMAVWQTQNAAPLHSVDKTLLHLALRQDEAKLKAQRRKENWMIYLVSAGVFVGMAFLLALLTYHSDRDTVTGWDFVIPVVAGAAALVSMRSIYTTHREQVIREQSFGESLRDQLKRRIAQLDDQATTAFRTSVLVTVLMGGICPTAILIGGWRINQKSISDDGYMLISLIVLTVWSAATGVWVLRHDVHQKMLPRKRELETLLKEIEGE